MYLTNKAQFDSTARFWTDCYAMPKDSSAASVTCYNIYRVCYCISLKSQSNPAVMRLMDMGFSEEDAKRALLETKGDENAAVEMLLN
jgi:hypothetical protein